MSKASKQAVNLKDHANDLWQEQKDVLDHATQVLAEAGRQVQDYHRSEIAPRVAAGVDVGKQQVGRVAGAAKDKLVDDVLPAVSRALVSAATVVELAKSQKVRDAVRKSVAPVVPVAKKGPGVGTWLLVGAGIVVVAGVAWAAWQTFKADDALFISEDEPESLGSIDSED